MNQKLIFDDVLAPWTLLSKKALVAAKNIREKRSYSVEGFDVKGLYVILFLIGALLCQVTYIHAADRASSPEPAPLPVVADLDTALFRIDPGNRPAKGMKLHSPLLSHSGRILYTSLTGTTSNRTTFDEGQSLLDWPMDMDLYGAAYQIMLRNFFEFEIAVKGSPWTRSSGKLEDYDWLDEAHYSGRAAHGGLDIYSRSTVDTQALMLDANARLYVLSVSPASVGLYFGFEGQEMDFDAYDTRQTGFGPWQDQTHSVSGPTSTYTVDYSIYKLGLSWRLLAGSRLKATLDTSLVPHADITDEDNHIRRQRISRTECNGHGTMISLATQFFVNDRWFLSSSCTKTRITANGEQRQSWYGNDPASMNFDDTGFSINGIDARIKQDSFGVSLAIGCRL